MSSFRTVRANAVFSLSTGLALLAGSPVLSHWFAAPAVVLAAVGAGVLGFGGLLALANRRTEGGAGVLRFAFAADVGWVVGASALFAFFPGVLSTAGWVALAAASLAVADFAVLEGRLLRRDEPAIAGAR